MQHLQSLAVSPADPSEADTTAECPLADSSRPTRNGWQWLYAAGRGCAEVVLVFRVPECTMINTVLVHSRSSNCCRLHRFDNTVVRPSRQRE